jgi:phosphoribosylglycinamide formyltransferase 2
MTLRVSRKPFLTVDVKTPLPNATPRSAFSAKPYVAGKRRMGVALARSSDIEKAREKARNAIAAIKVSL